MSFVCFTQIPPIVTVYRIGGQGVDFAYVIVVASTLPASYNGVHYRPDSEHWFLSSSVSDLGELLGNAEEIVIERIAEVDPRSPEEWAAFNAVVKDVEGRGRFAFYDTPGLDMQWNEGLPGQAGHRPGVLFVQAVDEEKRWRPRLAFETAEIDGGGSRLVAVHWMLRPQTEKDEFAIEQIVMAKAEYASLENIPGMSYRTVQVPVE